MGEETRAADRSIGQVCGLTIEELMVIGSSQLARSESASSGAGTSAEDFCS